MTALLVEAPLLAGEALARELYSPNLDLQQRLLVLDGLGCAAHEMAQIPVALPDPSDDAPTGKKD